MNYLSFSCEQRCNAYFGSMNMEQYEKDYRLRCRFLYKIYQAGISPMYTVDERKELVYRLIEDAAKRNDENNKVLNFVCAYKIAEYNSFNIEVPKIRLDETLYITNPPLELSEDMIRTMKECGRYERNMKFFDALRGNEEILEIYNVYIEKNYFGSLNTMKLSIMDGIHQDMAPIETFNRKNSNAIRWIIYLLHNTTAGDIKYHRLYFKEGKSLIEERLIDDEKSINCLGDPGRDYIEYYWVTFKGNSNMFSVEKDEPDEDVEKTEYKIALFYKDFDASSGNLHVLPGPIQVWKKGDNSELLKIDGGKITETTYSLKTPSGKPDKGEIYMEDGWIPLPNSPSCKKKASRDLYIFWSDMKDILDHIHYVIGGSGREFNTINRAGGRGNSENFYGKELPTEVYKNRETNEPLKLGRGRGTYSFLKFGDGEEPNAIISGYRIIYVENAGYFYDFNGTENIYQKGIIKKIAGDNLITESPNDFIETNNGKGYWNLNY